MYLSALDPMPSIISTSDVFVTPASSTVSSETPSRVDEEVIELFEEFRNPLLRYALSLGLSIHDAEEVIQEVFVALFRHLHWGRSRRNLRGWLFRVAHNLALKQRHAEQKVRERMNPEEAIAERPDPSANPEEQLSSAQRWNRLLAVVQALPESDRCCLWLRADGLRYREIAAVLGLSLGAVSISLTRSLARLIRANGR